MPASLPHDHLPPVPSFTVTSDDLTDGGRVPDAQVFDGWGQTGGNLSPPPSWSGFPARTAGLAITCLDPDAPPGSGLLPWVLFHIPASVTSLPPAPGAAPTAVGGR